jgi:hypothetical protein
MQVLNYTVSEAVFCFRLLVKRGKIIVKLSAVGPLFDLASDLGSVVLEVPSASLRYSVQTSHIEATY